MELSSSSEFREKISRSAALLERILKEDGVVYGVTTGYGDSCTVDVPPNLVAELPVHLTRFHGCAVNALVFTRHSLKFMEFLEQANPHALEHFMQVDSIGPESIARMQAKIDAGEWIAMVADRTSVSHQDRAIYCNFLGSEALLPPVA